MSALNISERDSVFESAATAARGDKWDSQSQRGTERFGHKWSWSRNFTGTGLLRSGTKGLISPFRFEILKIVDTLQFDVSEFSLVQVQFGPKFRFSRAWSGPVLPVVLVLGLGRKLNGV